MKQVLRVLKFEYATFVKSGTFIGMTVFMLLLGLIAPTVPTVINLAGQEGSFINSIVDDGKEEFAALVDPAGTFTPEEAREYLGLSVKTFANAEDAKQAVINGECEYAVDIETTGFSYTLFVPSVEVSTYNIQSDVDDMLRREYQLWQLNNSGVNQADAVEILDYAPSGEVVAVAVPGEDGGDYMENAIYAYVIVFLLYFALLMCGQYVLTSVIREKTTKTMELLVTSCKSWKLINGKVLGVGLAGLSQFGLLVIASLVSMSVNGMLTQSLSGESFSVSIDPGILGLMVVYFLLGFFAYSYMYAALASTVDRMEDANSIMGLPMFLIIGSFMAAIMGLTSPGETWVTVLSYVPFFTPMVMFMRVCLSAAAAWEVWVSVALQIVTILAVGWLSARIYRMGTLMYGKRLKLKDVFAAMR